MSKALQKDKLDTLSPAQLDTKIQDLETKLRELRFNKVTAAIDDPSQFRKLRKALARARTLRREYQIGMSEYIDGQRRHKLKRVMETKKRKRAAK